MYLQRTSAELCIKISLMYFRKVYKNFIYTKQEKELQLHLFRLFLMITINYILSSVLLYEPNKKGVWC